MSLIKISSSRGDYVLINLDQVAWATVDLDETGGARRITVHMIDGTTFPIKGAEADYVLEGLKDSLGESPSAPGLPG